MCPCPRASPPAWWCSKARWPGWGPRRSCLPPTRHCRAVMRGAHSPPPGWWTATRTWSMVVNVPTNSPCAWPVPPMKKWPRRVGASSRRRRPRALPPKTNSLTRLRRACRPCWPKASAPSRSSPATAWPWSTNASNCAWPPGRGGGLGVRGPPPFWGAPALPPEYAGRSQAYVDLVCKEMLPALAAEGLVDAVDVFCERIAFTLAETSQVFQAAQKLGIPVKLHAEQLSDMGGAALAARYGALSCDHIEHLSADGIAAMKAAGTVAVLLPGAYYTLRDTHLPPIAQLRAAGVPMAVSTDHNPGTSPALSLLLMVNMACTLFRLTVPEALAGITTHAARALGLQDSHGLIASGRPANFVLWSVGEAAELAYWLGQKPDCTIVRQGRIARARSEA